MKCPSSRASSIFGGPPSPSSIALKSQNALLLSLSKHSPICYMTLVAAKVHVILRSLVVLTYGCMIEEN